MLNKICRIVALLSLATVFPSLNQAVTITNASGEELYQIQYNNVDPTLGCNFNINDQKLHLMSTIKNGETVGYVIPNEQKVCIRIKMGPTTFDNSYELGPLSGNKCGIKVFEGALGTKISDSCVCTREGFCPRSRPDTVVNDPIGYGLTIKNTDNSQHSFDIYSTTDENVPTEIVNKAGSCWKHEGESLWMEGTSSETPSFDSGMVIATGYREKTNARRICMIAHIVGQKFALNPVNDVPGCHIEFYKIQGIGDNPGQLRATPQCGYQGRCPKKDAAGNDNPAELGDFYSDRLECCPEGYWNSDLSKCNPEGL